MSGSAVFLGPLQKTCREGQEEVRTEGPGEEGQEAKLQEGMRMEEERGREKGQGGEGRGEKKQFSLFSLNSAWASARPSQADQSTSLRPLSLS